MIDGDAGRKSSPRLSFFDPGELHDGAATNTGTGSNSGGRSWAFAYRCGRAVVHRTDEGERRCLQRGGRNAGLFARGEISADAGEVSFGGGKHAQRMVREGIDSRCG